MEKQKRRNITGIFILLTAAIIWGMSFVAQKTSVGFVGPFTFMGIRTLLGGITLLPVIAIINARDKKKGTYKKADKRTVLRWGGLVGILLCVATVLQQFGIQDINTTAGKSAFLSAMYVVLVPILSAVFYKKKIRGNVWIGAVLMVVGLFFLCVFNEKLTSFARGDMITIFCSIFFALQIIAVERCGDEVGGVVLSCTQFLVAGSISMIFALMFEEIDVQAILAITPALLYSGIMSCGIAYTFQILGQRLVESSGASIILSSESFFATVAGAIILGEVLDTNKIIGCVLMFAAIIISQLEFKRRKV